MSTTAIKPTPTPTPPPPPTTTTPPPTPPTKPTTKPTTTTTTTTTRPTTTTTIPENLAKSAIRTISNMMMTRDLTLKDVMDVDDDAAVDGGGKEEEEEEEEEEKKKKKKKEDMDGGVGNKRLPVLTAFNPDQPIIAEDFTASLLSSGLYIVGLMSGMMAGLIMIYKWWMFLLLLVIFMILTLISPKITDLLVSGMIITIRQLYVSFRHIMTGITATLPVYKKD